MTDRKKSIFNWNHISDKLTEAKIKELKAYDHTYHRKSWTYKQALKHFKKLKLIGNSLSVIFATGGLASAIVTSAIALVGVSTVAISIQGWMKHQSLDFKIQTCTYAYQSYQHLLNYIKDILRSGNYDIEILQSMMKYTDNFITDNSPVVDKFFVKYDKRFTS